MAWTRPTGTLYSGYRLSADGADDATLGAGATEHTFSGLRPGATVTVTLVVLAGAAESAPVSLDVVALTLPVQTVEQTGATTTSITVLAQAAAGAAQVRALTAQEVKKLSEDNKKSV